MRHARRHAALLVFVTLLGVGCTHAPPNASPAAALAFRNHQIQDALDHVRDIAHDANATTPPLLSTATTRKVTTWHRSALVIVHALGPDWRTVVTTGLDELLKDLPPDERNLLAPYVGMAKGLIEVSR